MKLKSTPPPPLNKKFLTPGKLLLIASVLCCGSLNAQTLCDTTYRISTGIVDAAWLTPPANTQRASMVNKFRWLNQSFPMKHLVFTSTPSIESPYFQYLNSNVTNLALPYDTLKLDFRPEDGWELIKRDFGFNVDGTPAATGVVNPSFIIYNKYTGTLRVFVARGELNNAANRAVIGINFPETPGLPSSMQTSALDLGLGNGPVALDQSFFKKDSSFYYSPVNYIGSYFKWMYADFPIIYDPCTCFYASLIQVKVDVINTADISLSGALSGKIETINNGTSS